jgi:hypothetical protein
MAKAGDEYQEIVGVVAKALDPGASVKVGQWMEGPDGRRDMDVEVRGTVNGAAYFALIECKDWKAPVGIKVVDALDSKRHDLNADRAIIYSNSGFTAPALRKAARVEIETFSALKAGDNSIRVVVERSFIAKELSVALTRIMLYPFPGETLGVDDGWQVGELMFDNLPVINWISNLSHRLIREQEEAKSITFRCTFRRDSRWTYQSRPIYPAGVELTFACSKRWLSQIVRPDVTLGHYDHLLRGVVVPDQQAYMAGWIDREAWVEVKEGWTEKELQPGTFRLYLTSLRSAPPKSDSASPKIGELIAEQDVRVE